MRGLHYPSTGQFAGLKAHEGAQGPYFKPCTLCNVGSQDARRLADPQTAADPEISRTATFSRTAVICMKPRRVPKLFVAEIQQSLPMKEVFKLSAFGKGQREQHS